MSKIVINSFADFEKFIGQELGVGAYLTNLRRTKIGDYSVENASSEILENEFRFNKAL